MSQVGDITAFGGPEQAANYLLPRKAVLYKFSKEVVALKPRITKLGEVPVPPRTYYRYSGGGSLILQRCSLGGVRSNVNALRHVCVEWEGASACEVCSGHNNSAQVLT